jgi:Ca2+/Na+ antiporter
LIVRVAGAVSNAVGSQVINVALGVGLPFLIYNLSTGLPIATPSSGLLLLTSCLLVVIGVYLAVALFPVLKIGQAGMHRWGGKILMLSFLG